MPPYRKSSDHLKFLEEWMCGFPKGDILKRMKILLITLSLLAEEISSSCLESLISAGHVQISIKSGNGLEFKGPVLDLGNHTYSIFDSCVDGFTPPPSTYAIVLHPGDNFSESLNVLSCNHKRWWPDVWTVVVLRNISLSRMQSEEFSRDIIHQLWKKAVYNCAVFIEGNNLVYKSDPFMTGNHCGKEVVSLKGGNCSVSRLPYRSRYPQCEIEVSGRDTFPFSIPVGDKFEGVDANLVQLIAEKSNLLIKWTSRPNRYTASYKVAHAYYDNISRNELELAIGGSVVSTTYFSNVTYEDSHVTQYLYFYVADSTELRGWQKLLAMFSTTIWVSILLSVVVSVVILNYFGEKNMSEYFLLVFGILLQETVSLPKGKLRIVLMCIVFPFFYISSTYTTILHSYTMNPPTTESINTFNDVIKANYSIMMSDTNRFIARKIRNKGIANAFKGKVIDNPGLEEAASLLEQYRNFTLVERDLEMDCLIAKRGYKVHNLKFTLATIRNSIVYPKGSKYGHRIHAMTVRAIESGLTGQWMKDIIKTKQLSRTNILIKRALSWCDVEPPFMILLTGYVISFLAFIIEIITSRLMDQNAETLQEHSALYNLE